MNYSEDGGSPLQNDYGHQSSNTGGKAANKGGQNGNQKKNQFMTPADYLSREQDIYGGDLNGLEDMIDNSQDEERQIDSLNADHASSFFSQSFKNQLNQNQILTGFNMSDCTQNLQIKQLQQLLHNEKSSPELLPYQTILIDKVTKLINNQEQQLQAPVRDTDDRFFFNIHKMELERVKYMLKSYLRTRILKIERQVVYIIEKDLASLLSDPEMQYAWTLYENKKNYFQVAMFNKIPTTLNPFEKDQLEERMITVPNSSEFVFARFLKSHDVFHFTKDIEAKIDKDNIYFLPYSWIKESLQVGEAELV
ncbi:UNKNOWN [Stylonychia lemnae]|uniref:GINS subunit domain-containing protein n=1 Tax=Stylonychia lemnae TaxID=5949 RepID=A0A078ADY7_STYLE|nr:UNKNOWN [Stylonychia lemnae]|eukprot:CDW80434.1 UNKNOWN [Stylonychia lemnae]